MNETISFLSMVGALVCTVGMVTGAYIWLRWGYCGVLAIWAIRKTLDDEVSQALKDAVMQKVQQ